MEKPFFTVITVCYNAGDGVRRAIEALRAQTCGDYQHIIKDGGSTDGSLDSVRSLTEGDGKTVLISRPDGGIYDAMNQALALAQGRYIYFLNCGDSFYDSSVLEDVKRFIESKSSVDTVNLRENGADGYSDDAIVYGDFLLRGEKIRQPERVDAFYLYRRPLNHQSMLFGRGVLKRYGGFDTSFSIRADHELTLRAYRGGSNFLRIYRVIAVYEGGGFSEREDKKQLRGDELKAIRGRYFTSEERRKYEARLRFSFSGLRARLRSERSPKWVRVLYRRCANFFNR